MTYRHRLARSHLAAVFLVLASAMLRAQVPAPQGSHPESSPSVFLAGDALEINTDAIADMTGDGRWLAITESVRRDGFGNDYRHDGDPAYVHATPVRLWAVDARTGQRTPVFNDKRAVRAMKWSPDGSQLAMLAWNGDTWEPVVWTRTSNKLATVKLPAGKYVAETSDLRWDAKGAHLVFAVHTTAWRKKARDTFTNMTVGPVFVQSSSDPFLAWDDLRRMGNHRSIGSVDVKSGAYAELVPEAQLGTYELVGDGSAVAYVEDQTKKTDYEVGGNDGKLIERTVATGQAHTLLSSTRGTQTVWAEDGSRFAYSRDGRVYVVTLPDSASKLIAGTPPSATPSVGPSSDSIASGARGGRTGRGGGRGAAESPDRFSVSRFSPRGDAVLVSNREGFWVIDIATGARELAMATNDSNRAVPRVTVDAWSDDGSKLYFNTASKTQWERGITRYDRATKQRTELVKSGRSYSNLRLSKDGNTAFVTVTEGNRPGDIFTADGSLAGLHRFIESNPQLASKTFGPTELMPFLDADGHSQYAVVHYPANYENGKAYPTVFIVYEDFFDDTFDVAANILAAQGYVVVKPSVAFETGYPGEAWLKGVTGAANKLIERGIADSSRLGVQGTSYGGYAVNLLVTQTHRFAAAINISGKVDLISFYTDSPRLGVRNITAAERQQDRIGATLWQQPQKYVQHSAIMFADRITTPLLLITGAQDSNVPADNTREMYYALRRLGKEVVWVDYMNGGHGGGVQSADDFLDEYRRMIEWYDSKLKKPSTAKTATNSDRN